MRVSGSLMEYKSIITLDEPKEAKKHKDRDIEKIKRLIEHLDNERRSSEFI